MGILRVIDKSNDEIISVCEIEDLWVNGQQINAITTEVNTTKLQNQKAIECLKELRQEVLIDNYEDYSVDLNYLVETIDTKIKELGG